MRRRLLVITLICFSLVNCWTRLYLGVHYPGDIMVGLIWGTIVGYSVYRLYCRVTKPAVYSERLCYVPIAVFLLTLVFALCRGCYMTYV